MKVIVFGGCGYIGAQLIPQLLAEGHKVKVYDLLWFGDGGMPDNDSLEVLEGPEYTADAIIYLASMSNNAMCELNPVLEHRYNRVEFLNTFSKVNTERFLYASSVAAYGSSDEEAVETWPLRPTTLYGAGKALCESRVLGKRFTAVRSASVVGTSLNMRFDTTINKMCHDAVRKGKIRVNGGLQYRTHVSVKDVCDFYCLLLKVPVDKIAGQAFNVVDENQTVAQSASLVQEVSGCEAEFGGRTDERSYLVSGEKALKVLDWKPKYTLRRAVTDVITRLEAGYWKDSDHPKYQRMRYDL